MQPADKQTPETAAVLLAALHRVAPLLAALARGVEDPADLCAYQRGPDLPALAGPQNALAWATEQLGTAALAALPPDPPAPPVPFAYQVI